MASERPVLLVVDDKVNMLRLMTKVMGADAEVLTAEGGGEALRLLTSRPVDAILCDLRMPDMTGIEVLKAAKRLRPSAEFVLMTAYASVGTAVEALKLGAFDYLTKPFDNDTARSLLLRALASGHSAEDDAPQLGETLPGLVGASEPMKELAELVRRVAASEATALILGETGTGKERVARAIHDLSPRAPGRFVALNCAAVPAELLESELFGHKKGAFTGATQDRTGLFEEAQGGTLFLDELGDLRLSLQAKLTRVLEERVIRPVGEVRERPIDVRVVAATHRDVESMVKDGSFREDLWYRLNVAALRIPPLRERRGDVELLARHFVAMQGSRSARRLSLSNAALEGLIAFDWPGNVRQLRAAIERACLVAASDEIGLGDLPPEVLRGAQEPDVALASCTWAEALEHGRTEAGRRYLEAVLERFGGRISDAARHAGVERESFYRLLRKHGVEAAAFRRRP